MRKMAIALIAVLLLQPGCLWRKSGKALDYETLATDPRRDTETARRLNAEATELLERGQLERAEKVLKKALAADIFSGPAHNNLGAVYYRQEKHYLAAWEFQYAAKLMAACAQPRNNLGMVFEAVGRLDDATAWYEQAMEVEPDNIEIVGNLARILVRTDHKDERTRKLLAEIALRDSRPEWSEWARERLALMGQAEADDRKLDAE